MNRRRKLLLFGGDSRIQGLLNTAFGANAAAAYSLRMLNGDLIGQDIIEVKRVANSDFDRFKLTADGIPQAQIASFCGASDGIVSWLQDQSGRGFAISQTAESACPLLYESGEFNEIKGKPALRFAGAQFLENEELTETISGLLVLNVLRAGENRLFSRGRSTTLTAGDYYEIGNTGGCVRYANDATTLFRVRVAGDPYSPNAELKTHYWNGLIDAQSEMQLKRNGILTQDQITTTSFGTSTPGIRIGKVADTSFYTGFWNEFITYHTDRLADIPAIESNILEHYDLP